MALKKILLLWVVNEQTNKNENQPTASKPEIDSKLQDAYSRFEKLLIELRKKELPDAVVAFVNNEIEELNLFSGPGDEMKKKIKEKQIRIIELLEKKLIWCLKTIILIPGCC